MYVNGPKKQHFELLKDGAKEELHILVAHCAFSYSSNHASSNIYLYTQISSLLRTLIYIYILRKSMVQ